MRKILVSDFTIKEAPHGGSEWVNEVLIDKFNLEFEYSANISSWDKDNFYIISNISLMNEKMVREIPSLNYIIIENDYKICQSRHPWRWDRSIVPISERINYDLYKQAKTVFVQTTDHLNVYKANNVIGNFINLECSIWSEDDLVMLEKFFDTKKIKSPKSVIYNTNNWIKNTNGAVEYCKKNNIDFEFVENQVNRIDFLDKLSNYRSLVFLPIARETFCRLVVEAKCMGLDVITSKNYGASLENWFDMSGKDLTKFLRLKTKINLNKISEYIV
jgi:hypothetical protein